MKFEIFVIVFMILNTLSTIIAWILILKLLERTDDDEDDEKDEKKIEQDLTTRLRDLQTRQFSLDLTAKIQQRDEKNDEKR